MVDSMDDLRDTINGMSADICEAITNLNKCLDRIDSQVYGLVVVLHEIRRQREV